METEKKENVEINPADVVDVKELEKRPNLAVRAGRWVWRHKGYVVTGIGSFIAGVAAATFFGRDDNGEIETTDEVNDEGPTED